MATNYDLSRSSLLSEQYQHDMELIALALQDESQDEREDRLGLVARSWSLTSTCFHAQLNQAIHPLTLLLLSLIRNISRIDML